MRDSDNPFGRKPGTNGAVPDGMAVQPVPMEDVREPIDLVAVQADDELINALAAGMAVSSPGVGGYDADDHVAALLAAWKADVDADPIPEIDLDVATSAVLAGRRRPAGRARHLAPVASAAALIVVAITGVSIGAKDTRPGDTLFPIAKVLYSEEATSYEALATVEQSQATAKRALAVGDKAGAAAAVAQGEAAAKQVLAEHGHGEVMQELHQLQAAVDETTPGVPNKVDEDQKPPQTAAQPGPTGSTSEPSAAGSSTATTKPAPEASAPEQVKPEPSRAGTQEPEPSRPESPPPSSTSEPSGTGGEKPPAEPGPTADRSGSGGAGTGKPGTDGAPAARSPEPGSPAAQPPPPAPGTTEKQAQPTSTAPTTPPPTTTAPPATSGISGASASASGTATPSGEPTSG